jgi:hypothetical protein
MEKVPCEVVMQLSNAQVFHFNQSNDGGTNKQVVNDISDGYQLYINELKEELKFFKEEFLKKK